MAVILAILKSLNKFYIKRLWRRRRNYGLVIFNKINRKNLEVNDDFCLYKGGEC